MNQTTFAAGLQRALLTTWPAFASRHERERPYALALVGGQSAEFLGYAIATETGLQEIATQYESLGYRYHAHEQEQFDNREKLSTWLRWSNPDDGWRWGEFGDGPQFGNVASFMTNSDDSRLDGESIEGTCVDVLATFSGLPAWEKWRDQIVIGFTFGTDPRDFLRTATRACPYQLVKRVWGEYWAADTMSPRITRINC